MSRVWVRVVEPGGRLAEEAEMDEGEAVAGEAKGVLVIVGEIDASRTVWLAGSVVGTVVDGRLMARRGPTGPRETKPAGPWANKTGGMR